VKRAAVALIDESRCIGCTRCIDACPVDAIVGAQAQMHTVVERWCIGCALCPPACPVDCIDMVRPRGAWTDALKRAAGTRARLKQKREVAYRSSDPADRRRVLARILGKKS
jgi:Na+-translocating ferredoxin:NAD+ oxidoreductase subunit B